MPTIDWLIQDAEVRALLDEMVALCDRLGIARQRMRESGNENAVYEADCINDFLFEIGNLAADAGLAPDDD